MIEVSVLTEGDSLISSSQREIGHVFLSIAKNLTRVLQLFLIDRPLKMKTNYRIFQVEQKKLNCF
jgi:hypothetical protein